MLFDILKIVFIIIIYLILYTLVFMTNYKQYIIDNWGQYKCKPFIIPLAGFFGHDVNSTFQDCLFLSTSANSGSIMSPSLNITSLMGDVLGDMGGALNSLRSGMSDIRGFFGSTLGSLTDRISNTILVVQKTIIKFRSIIGKLLGVMTTLIYTLYTTIATMNSTIAGPIGDLAGLACFHQNTLIKVNNNDYRPILKIKVGDELKGGGRVISTFKFKNIVPLYNHNNILVSGDHLVEKNGQWKRIDSLDLSVDTNKIEEIHCLTSSQNRITTYNGTSHHEYRDYIETSNYCINTFIKKCVLNFLNNQDYQDSQFLLNYQKQIEEASNNNFYVFGFHENTLIKMKDHTYKKISELEIDDITFKQERVTGTVIHLNTDRQLYNLDGTIVSGEQIVYYQGTYRLVKSILGLEIIEEGDILYQVTTNKGTIHIGNHVFRDHHESKDSELNNYIDRMVLSYLNNRRQF